jgi:hypothetical protein
MTQQFEQQLQNNYDNLTREQLVTLLNEVINSPLYRNGTDEMVYSIITTIRSYHTETGKFRISFKQWKLLNAFVIKQQKPTYKTL